MSVSDAFIGEGAEHGTTQPDREDAIMGVMISALSSSQRDFTETEHAAIDEKSFSLSEGNWKEHLVFIFYTQSVADEDDFCINEIGQAVEDILDIYGVGEPPKDDLTLWHVQTATKLHELIEVGRKHGCDRIGIAG